MDAFELLVASILEREGFWVRSSFKVELTKEEKQEINRPTSPRWEIDLVAYKAGTNELRIIECKSYLDSRGVAINAFDGSNEGFANRFKIFNDEKLRSVVVNRLVTQLVERKAILSNPKIIVCLAAGKIASVSDKDKLKAHFESNDWELLDDEWLCKQLMSIADGGYQNDVADVVAKLLLRTKYMKCIT
ncbi:restriction endonuclease [Geomonas subterranea]|uniref:restriction endonuclease n=1 Tax=Geomonas subterranea TaxID=2847989 RepID=UPI001CD633CE|nr:restriction endonuclease [Geomonas fuzhouensis]